MGTTYETVAPPQGEGLTFEKVWASLMELKDFQRETDRRIATMSEETDRRVAAMREETDRRVAAMREETDRRIAAMGEETDRLLQETARQMKETDKRMGDLTKRFGETVEYMVLPNLVAKFQELDFVFSRVARDIKIVDREHDIITEIDAFLENGDKVMVVETKVKPNTKDIDDHIERMGKLRAYADLRQDRRVYLGALAGVVFDEGVKTYALKNGFYVLEPSGETFTIIQPKDRGYSPREW
ncbi:MAG: hypothetical protein LBU21_01965 [Treponema sp.]|jgi:hypothetical protein|nr:hypothetical protein [Treponema sp.]